VRPWENLASAHAPDGTLVELARRGDEYLIRAGGYDLMSSEDEASSRALASYACGQLSDRDHVRVLIGGLGMGFTLREALERLAPSAVVEVSELVPSVVEWNRGLLGGLAADPLSDPRTHLWVGDVSERIGAVRDHYHAILLDVDNGPDALAHGCNDLLYGPRGIERATNALVAGGVFAVWSFSDDAAFTRRLESSGFDVSLHRVAASRRGRGRNHFVWVASKPA